MNRPGFTLLEVLVAATVIAVLSGISLVGYNRFQERQQLVSAKEQLRSDLRLTQQKALAGEKPTLPTPWCTATGESLSSWRLVFISSTVYEIRGICSSGATVTDKSVTLTGNAAKIAGASQIDFAPLTGTVAANTSFTLQTTTASGNWRATVNVSSAGLIESTDIGL